jgi:hypothetical protein
MLERSDDYPEGEITNRVKTGGRALKQSDKQESVNKSQNFGDFHHRIPSSTRIEFFSYQLINLFNNQRGITMTVSNNIIIHVNEKMNSQRRATFSNDVQQLAGVVSVEIQDNKPHLLIVGFNHSKTKALDILSGIRKSGSQAQLISWL